MSEAEYLGRIAAADYKRWKANMKYVDRGPNGCPGLEGDHGRHWRLRDEAKFYCGLVYYTGKVIVEGLVMLWRQR